MKLGLKVSAVFVLFGILLIASSYAFAEDRTVKVKLPGFISETETTGITGVNNALTITDDDIDEEVEKIIDSSENDKNKDETTKPAK